MGGKVSLLRNSTSKIVEFRVWIYPARPDRFVKIIRIKPGGCKHVSLQAFRRLTEDLGSAMLMVYVDGAWTGKYILPLHLMEFKYVVVSSDINQPGQVTLRGRRANFSFCRLKFYFVPCSPGNPWECLKRTFRSARS